MRVVVVGGMGFLGGAVVDALLERGDDVCVADPHSSRCEAERRFGAGRVTVRRADILEPSTLVAAFAGADEVYHFAGRLGTSELDDDLHGAIACNITGAVNVFESAIAAGVPTVFYPSKPNVWLNAYTITKAASEEFARLFTHSHPLRIRTLRFFNAYGPHQATAPIRKIIPSFTREALAGEPLTVYGDGEQTVDMIYSADLGHLTVEFTRSPAHVDVADCGRGVAMTVNEVAGAVNAIVGNRAGIHHVPMRRGETPNTRLVADVAPLAAAVDPLRFSDWESSLELTIAWYARQPGVGGRVGMAVSAPASA